MTVNVVEFPTTMGSENTSAPCQDTANSPAEQFVVCTSAASCAAVDTEISAEAGEQAGGAAAVAFCADVSPTAAANNVNAVATAVRRAARTLRLLLLKMLLLLLLLLPLLRLLPPLPLLKLEGGRGLTLERLPPR